ncbi:MAG: ATP-binding cassette protein [Chitinophagaceae bacterium]|nr:ATP-binding cassette protein [Chitinophagaceae bacterium]
MVNNHLPILSINHISKNYGSIKALNDVSFEVPEGCVFGILGPNGSGKTTMLGIILDVLQPKTGTFAWFGKPGSADTRKQIGSLLETPNFYHYLSAINNLKITQAISKRGTPKDIDKVLEVVKLDHRKNSKFSTYSLGMKQRLAIGAALLGNPQVLVFDEPTNGLDPVGIAEIRELIKELSRQGKTIIMASHLLDEVEKVCTHVAILKRGELITAGNVDEVLSNEDIVEVSANDLTALQTVIEKLGAYTTMKREHNTLQIFYPVNTANMENINRHCFENGIVLSQLQLKKKSLETKFFELTNN